MNTKTMIAKEVQTVVRLSASPLHHGMMAGDHFPRKNVLSSIQRRRKKEGFFKKKEAFFPISG